MCTGSPPWPYRTAGTFADRRMRRAAPLPNSVRGSAWMLLSDTVLLLVAVLYGRGGSVTPGRRLSHVLDGCCAREGVAVGAARLGRRPTVEDRGAPPRRSRSTGALPRRGNCRSLASAGSDAKSGPRVATGPGRRRCW